MQYIKENNMHVEVTYDTDIPENVLGYQQGHTIVIFANSTKSVIETASTLVHEVTHAKYNIGGNQWSEAQCFAAEHLFKFGKPLTFADKKAIIKMVKKNYPNFNWRRVK
ncbi:MAG: hypothetical protein MR291_08360 [Oscillospiraceae bacterium]|nr:hypothetical protein [Oscillospiraceae bacterium]